MASRFQHRLGELLVQRGIISRQQLAQALVQQRSRPGFIGEILIDMGAITRGDLTHTLALQRSLSRDAATE